MTTNQLLIDAFERVKETVHSTVEGMKEDDLAWQPNGNANSIAWLVWHMGRVIDAQLAPLSGDDETWVSGGWHDIFDLPFAATETGYGMSSRDVAQVRATSVHLLGYCDAVHTQIISYLKSLDDAAYDDIVDANWNPPVTRGVRLVSILNDCTQHVGQAAYVKGLLAQ